jgi:hypothetical protein
MPKMPEMPKMAMVDGGRIFGIVNFWHFWHCQRSA